MQRPLLSNRLQKTNSQLHLVALVLFFIFAFSASILKYSAHENNMEAPTSANGFNWKEFSWNHDDDSEMPVSGGIVSSQAGITTPSEPSPDRQGAPASASRASSPNNPFSNDSPPQRGSPSNPFPKESPDQSRADSPNNPFPVPDTNPFSKALKKKSQAGESSASPGPKASPEAARRAGSLRPSPVVGRRGPGPSPQSDRRGVPGPSPQADRRGVPETSAQRSPDSSNSATTIQLASDIRKHFEDEDHADHWSFPPSPQLLSVPGVSEPGPSAISEDEIFSPLFFTHAQAEKDDGPVHIAREWLRNVATDEVQLYESPEQIPAEPTRARCSDPEVGYETLVGPCSAINYEYLWVDITQRVKIPMVLDENGECQAKQCSHFDKWTCCRKRRRCHNYAIDVPQGCPDGKVVNPYQYAMCQTMPCTREDETFCCIVETGALLKRLSPTKIYARTGPNDEAPFTNPSFLFQPQSLAWVDLNRIGTINADGDEWKILVNFMQNWGPGYGWRHDAYIKIQTKHKQDFQTLRLKVHNLDCESTLDAIPDYIEPLYSGEIPDVHIIQCPRFCFGKPRDYNGVHYYEWKYLKTPITKQGIPLFIDRDSAEPSLHARFSEKESFISEGTYDTRGNRVWVRIRTRENPSQIYWMPTIVEIDGEAHTYANQVVPEVKGGDAGGFFTPDSPICVAARTLGLFGGVNEMIELTVATLQRKYKSVTRGGIQTSDFDPGRSGSPMSRSYQLQRHVPIHTRHVH